MCKRVNAHKEGKEGKGNGKQKIENRKQKFPVPISQFQRANVLTCKRANVPIQQKAILHFSICILH